MNELVHPAAPLEEATLPDEWQRGIAMARKYATQGPRYTSYPTAPQFSEDFDLQRYRNWQAGKPRRTEPLSIYVHLPFCHDICYYCACNKIVTRKPGVASEYLRHLSRELAMQSELVGADGRSRRCTGAAARRPTSTMVRSRSSCMRWRAISACSTRATGSTR
jgi:hypothetical protein